MCKRRRWVFRGRLSSKSPWRGYQRQPLKVEKDRLLIAKVMNYASTINEKGTDICERRPNFDHSPVSPRKNGGKRTLVRLLKLKGCQSRSKRRNCYRSRHGYQMETSETIKKHDSYGYVVHTDMPSQRRRYSIICTKNSQEQVKPRATKYRQASNTTGGRPECYGVIT